MDIYEEIAKLKAELEYLKRHKDYLKQVKQELNVLEEELQVKEDILKKENDDVEKLEKTTIASLFHKLSGHLDEKMEKERYEAMQASVEYHRIHNEYEIKKIEIDSLEMRFSKENEIAKKLHELQLEVFKKDNPLKKDELEKELAELERVQNIIKEIDEALNVGYPIQENLKEIRVSLEKAKDWGVYDMIGGGLLANAMKHNHIDNAQKAIQNVQYQIQRFEKEVKDVQMFSLSMNNIGSELKMADLIFDSIIFDWMVQSKINSNMKCVEETLQQISSTLDVLERKKEENLYQKECVQQKIQNILQRS